MRKLIIGILMAATVMPATAMAQSPGELRRDRQDVRQEQHSQGQTKRPERDKVAETDCSPGRHRGVDQRQPSGAVRRRWMCPCDLPDSTDRPSTAPWPAPR